MTRDGRTPERSEVSGGFGIRGSKDAKRPWILAVIENIYIIDKIDENRRKKEKWIKSRACEKSRQNCAGVKVARAQIPVPPSFAPGIETERP